MTTWVGFAPARSRVPSAKSAMEQSGDNANMHVCNEDRDQRKYEDFGVPKKQLKSNLGPCNRSGFSYP